MAELKAVLKLMDNERPEKVRDRIAQHDVLEDIFNPGSISIINAIWAKVKEEDLNP